MITMERTKKRSREDAPALAAGKRFGRYRKESLQRAREATVKENPKLRRLVERWQKFYEVMKPVKSDALVQTLETPEVMLGIAREFIRMKRIERRLVQEFCIRVSGMKPEFSKRIYGEEDYHNMLGAFLSAMTEYGGSKNYYIPAYLFDGTLGYVGTCNTKNVIVDGSALVAAAEMKGGTLEIVGDVEILGNTGILGGTITVHGDVESGIDMSEGTVVRILGNWLPSESYMRIITGELHVDGDVPDYEDILVKRGKLFHKGKLVLEK